MIALLSRNYQPDRTTGLFTLKDGDKMILQYPTLELPNLDNQRQISCIPQGDYVVTKTNSPKFGECFRVNDVIGRDHILIHVGNFLKDSTGCILIGTKLNDKGDLVNSGVAFRTLLAHAPDRFLMLIR
jgi:hypothetical protein